MVGTFAMVLFFTMLKDAYEDFKRYATQKELNTKMSQVFKETEITKKKSKDPTHEPKFEDITWESVKAGHIVKVKKD